MVTESQPEVRLDPIVLAALRDELGTVSDQVVAVVVAEVPSYRDAFSGPMGRTIRDAVALALDGFLELGARGGGSDAGTPLGPVVEGAYRLGRGEARAGRSMEALLAAYRTGARRAWRLLSDRAVAAGLADELETTGRVRQRLLERLARQLVTGATPATLDATTKRAEWTPPETLTAVLLPPGQVRGAEAALGSRALVAGEDLPDLDSDEVAVLLVPDVARPVLLRALDGRHAVVGQAVGWRQVRSSYLRAVRARDLGLGPGGGPAVDTDRHLARLVLEADQEALADLRTRALGPLAELRPASAEKLTETLRAWLLCRGRREEVAGLLHVHPQTVRYRVGQLRELYGERLDDPESVLELTLALGTDSG